MFVNKKSGFTPHHYRPRNDRDLSCTMRNGAGFTLVELLVVLAILGVLMIVSLANFRTSQQKARDAQRKSDLHQITNALEAYMTDKGGYPSASSGKIKACADSSGTCKPAATADACDWGGTGSREMCDENNTVYIKEVPGDPGGAQTSQTYCYYSEGSLYRLYAILENANDPEILPAGAYKSCGASYNFGISSSNTTP